MSMANMEKRKQLRIALVEFLKHYPFTTDDLDGEEWRDIKGHDGYQVSNYGRVKSFKCPTPRILKPCLDKRDYPLVYLSNNGDCYPALIHRLVAKTFVSNPSNKPQVNHIDGCRLNACASNLEWVTPSENILHAVRIGALVTARGEERNDAKLTNEQVRYIRENPDNLIGTQLAEMFKVGKSTISNVQLGKRYKDSGGSIRTEKYDFVPDEIRTQIRAEYVKGDCKLGAKPLARKYGIDNRTVRSIVAANIPNEIRAQIRAEYIKRDNKRGATALAKKYGIDRNTIAAIVNEK